MKKYIVEFIGTFFLVLVIGLNIVEPGSGALAPIAIGAALMVMVYAGGPISGAHYNPAVTLAVWMRGKFDAKDALPYMLMQILGAVVAALLVNYLKSPVGMPPPSLEVVPALIVEFLFTFALAFVVLNVATSSQSAGNSYFGLAIGFTFMVAVFAARGISGGAINPAVAVGISTMGLVSWASIWIYLVASFLGGAAAAMVFKVVNPGD
jgi:aquaporin Z